MSIDPKQYRPAFIAKALEAEDAQRQKRDICLKCPTRLLGYQKYYCSGTCMNEAKMDGSYGHEAE